MPEILQTSKKENEGSLKERTICLPFKWMFNEHYRVMLVIISCIQLSFSQKVVKKGCCMKLNSLIDDKLLNISTNW